MNPVRYSQCLIQIVFVIREEVVIGVLLVNRYLLKGNSETFETYSSWTFCLQRIIRESFHILVWTLMFTCQGVAVLYFYHYVLDQHFKVSDFPKKFSSSVYAVQ